MESAGPVEPAESKKGSKGEAGNRPPLFRARVPQKWTPVLRPEHAPIVKRTKKASREEPDMLQDIPTPTSTLHEARPFVLETERLMLRRPTLADVKAIALLANDLRVSINLRRVPHPYLQDHAVEFVRALAEEIRNTVFLIECD